MKRAKLISVHHWISCVILISFLIRVCLMLGYITDGSISVPGDDPTRTLTKTHFSHQTPLMNATYSNRLMESSEIHALDYDWITDDLILQAMGGFQPKK